MFRVDHRFIGFKDSSSHKDFRTTSKDILVSFPRSPTERLLIARKTALIVGSNGLSLWPTHTRMNARYSPGKYIHNFSYLIEIIAGQV